MRNSIQLKFQSSITHICVLGVLLILISFPNYSYGQCPNDTTIYVGDDCMATVQWNEPVYSELCNNFEGAFDATDDAIWSLNSNGQDGTANTSGAPSSISLTGSTDGTSGTNIDTDFCITMPYDGSLSFDWSAVANSGGAQLINDEPAYTINGVETRLNIEGDPVGSGVSMEDGTIEDLSLSAGDVFCFRVKSNNVAATTSLDISNFSVEIDEIAQSSGVANSSDQGPGVYPIEYEYLNCDGTNSICSFEVTVLDTIAPTIICPSDIVMSQDDDRCTAVVCYGLEVMDNCEAIIPTSLPGYQFIGTFGGHSYFTVDLLDALTWEEANIEAANIGGHLVSITSQEEQDFLIDNLGFGRYWIGLRYSPNLDAFKWVNGEEFVYEDWGLGQPGILEGDYVFNLDFFGTVADGWYDSESLLPARYIVELESYQTRLISGLPPGANFQVGTTEIIYEVTDSYENTDTCTFNVVVNEFVPDGLPCIDDINFSLDEETCTGELTADMLIDVSLVGCIDNCSVTVIGSDGEERPAIFTSEDVGERFEYEICCGGVCCWGFVDVEYKFKPIIECETSIEVSCALAVDPDLGKPSGDINCADVTITKLNDEYDFYSCDPLYVGKLVRTWIAEDEYGNVSEPCSTEILLTRTNTSIIRGPISYWVAGGNELSCDNNFDLNEYGYPTPQSINSVPQLQIEGGEYVDLYPFEAGTICNGYVTYTDKELGGSTECVTKVKRTWTVGEWHCTNPEPRTYVQVLEIVDFTGPEFDPVADRVVSTSSFECEAIVSMPVPEATDACNGETIRLDLGTPAGTFENYSGTSFILPVGIHDVIYNMYDDCGNITVDTTKVTVVDNADPIAVCDLHTVVSIGLDGLTFVSAADIDDGSFDECGDVTLSIARMDEPGFDDRTGFKDKVAVHCTDIGTVVMVGLLVTDKGGNTNMCMVEVIVQDKIKAQMIVPGPITVDCNFAYDPNNLGAFFGEVEIFDNCDTVNTDTDEVMVGELNGCGSGQLIREITLIENGVEVGFGTQTITFTPGTTLQLADIEWPDEEVEFEGCPNNVNTDMTGIPIVTPRDCQNIDMRMQDEVFPFNTNGTCRKILRTWNVIDWCIPLYELGGALNPFTFTQTIKVNNSIAPTFVSVPRDSVYCSYATDCGAISVSNLIATATDECTDASDLFTSYEVTNSQGIVVSSGSGLDASDVYDIEKYVLKYTIEDRCGNVNATFVEFEVRNCKQPTPYCIDGLSTSLVPMDLDDNGSTEIELVMLTPDFFDGGSFHPCGYDVTLSFSALIDDTLRVFGCNDLGENTIELWATDINGNSAFCETTILIEDNNGVNTPCLPVDESERVDVQGTIYTSSHQVIEDVIVDLQGSDLPWEYTSEEGEYLFDHMPLGGNYEVMPQKNNDLTNGVNTLDLLFIQRHILGAQPITDTYKLIAADINNDGSIKPSDLLDLRKVILGINHSFNNNTSWRFVDEAYQFSDASNPLDEEFNESYKINNLSEDMNIDFIGVKVGDVNGDASVGAKESDLFASRSDNQYNLKAFNRQLQFGLQKIDIISESKETIYGMQTAFGLENVEFVSMESGKLNIDPLSYKFINGELRLSHISDKSVEVEKDDVLFSIVVRVEKPIEVADFLTITEKFIDSEIYVGNTLEVSSVKLKVISDNDVEHVFNVNQNTPNPWSRTTVVDIETPKAGTVHMTVLDGQGQLVYRLDRYFEQGQHSILLTDEQISQSGIYIYRVEFDKKVVTGRMIRIR